MVLLCLNPILLMASVAMESGFANSIQWSMGIQSLLPLMKKASLSVAHMPRYFISIVIHWR